MSDHDTTRAIMLALANRHQGSEWAFLAEVRNDAGYRADRTADAIALNLWPSNGLHLHGFEVKASRGDWMREMDHPDKAEAFARYCNFWWLVTAPDVAKLEEVPAAWGLMELKGDKLKVRRAASFREGEPITRGMVASMFRRFTENAVPAFRVKQDISTAVEGVRNQYEREHGRDIQRMKDLQESDRLLKRIGYDIGYSINADNVGEVMAIFRKGSEKDIKRHVSDLEFIRDEANRLASAAERSIEIVKEGAQP